MMAAADYSLMRLASPHLGPTHFTATWGLPPRLWRSAAPTTARADATLAPLTTLSASQATSSLAASSHIHTSRRGKHAIVEACSCAADRAPAMAATTTSSPYGPIFHAPRPRRHPLPRLLPHSKGRRHLLPLRRRRLHRRRPHPLPRLRRRCSLHRPTKCQRVA